MFVGRCECCGQYTIRRFNIDTGEIMWSDYHGPPSQAVEHAIFAEPPEYSYHLGSLDTPSVVAIGNMVDGENLGMICRYVEHAGDSAEQLEFGDEDPLNALEGFVQNFVLGGFKTASGAYWDCPGVTTVSSRIDLATLFGDIDYESVGDYTAQYGLAYLVAHGMTFSGFDGSQGQKIWNLPHSLTGSPGIFDLVLTATVTADQSGDWLYVELTFEHYDGSTLVATRIVRYKGTYPSEGSALSLSLFDFSYEGVSPSDGSEYPATSGLIWLPGGFCSVMVRWGSDMRMEGYYLVPGAVVEFGANGQSESVDVIYRTGESYGAGPDGLNLFYENIIRIGADFGVSLDFYDINPQVQIFASDGSALLRSGLIYSRLNGIGGATGNYVTPGHHVDVTGTVFSYGVNTCVVNSDFTVTEVTLIGETIVDPYFPSLETLKYQQFLGRFLAKGSYSVGPGSRLLFVREENSSGLGPPSFLWVAKSYPALVSIDLESGAISGTDSSLVPMYPADFDDDTVYCTYSGGLCRIDGAELVWTCPLPGLQSVRAVRLYGDSVFVVGQWANAEIARINASTGAILWQQEHSKGGANAPLLCLEFNADGTAVYAAGWESQSDPSEDNDE